MWVSEGVAAIGEIVGGATVEVTDRAAAERLTNTKLFIDRERLPPPGDDEYYFADLIGLTAIGADGMPLGIVSAVHDYGAGTSLEINRADTGSLLIPFNMACVPDIDITAGTMTVIPPDEIDVAETASAAGNEVGTMPDRDVRHMDGPSPAGAGTIKDAAA